jgi:uracil phosphoribosyltransferase
MRANLSKKGFYNRCPMLVLTEQNSVANHFIAELRDQKIQKDSMRFRRNLERLGELLAYEISKKLDFEPRVVNTPLGIAETMLLAQQPVLITILRAGLPFYQGFLNFFDRAESAFVGAFRGPHEEDFTFEIEMHYIAAPELTAKPVVIIDPMLATGKSVVVAANALRRYGNPAHVYVAAAIASRQGIDYLHQHLQGDYSLWVGDVDDELNNRYYIVPGLGDAGDLAFGNKLDHVD